ncbi:MAG: cytidine deaminase [Nocardioides sp.]
MPDDATPDLPALTDADDQKLVTLARSTRARTGAAEGACVRDQDGRTYAGATVDLPSFSASAAQVAVAMAVSSGARSLEAVVVLGDTAALDEADLSVVRDFSGAGVAVHLAAPDGTVVASVRS